MVQIAAVQKIKELLDSEIRPAVAMDGGDIIFHDYKDNILYFKYARGLLRLPQCRYHIKRRHRKASARVDTRGERGRSVLKSHTPENVQLIASAR